MERPVMIFGASGMGKMALDIFVNNGVEVYGLLDDDESLHQTSINEIPVLGATEEEQYLHFLGDQCEAFVATDETKYKKRLVEMLNSEYEVMPVNAIHYRAFVSDWSTMGHGNLLAAGSVVNTHAVAGNHCVLHCNSVIDHDARIEDYVQVGAGSIIGANATVLEEAFIGSGVTLVPGVTIGRNASVGAGSVVIQDVKDNETVLGNPAETV